MRRIALTLLVAAWLLAMMALPAFATVHPLSEAECSAPPAGDTAGTQDPPGLTPGGPDSSNAQTAQPLLVADENAFKPDPDCPAPQK
jgi:hypothetical protein